MYSVYVFNQWRVKSMGLFDFSKANGTGFAKVPNKLNLTNEDLLDKLSNVRVTFGTPEMGKIGDYQAVLYKKVTKKYSLFVRTSGKSIIMGKIAGSGASMGLDYSVSIATERKDEQTSIADHAVDELSEIVGKIARGEEVSASTAVASINTETGELIELFMQQKVLNLTPDFNIFDADENAIYYIEGDPAQFFYTIYDGNEEIARLSRKIIALMPEYIIKFDGEEIGRIKKKARLTNAQFTGIVNGEELMIEGDMYGFDFDIRVGDKIIGHVDTNSQLFRDSYRISVYDEAYQDLVVILAIICDKEQDGTT